MSQLSVLLVGYGFRGRHWAEACAGRSDLALRGVVDPSPSAREAAGAAGLPTWPTLEEALEQGGSEAAVVASPAANHVAHGTACLESGLAVLMEKPLATSLADAMRLRDVARSTGRSLLVGQNFRFRPRELTIRSLIEDGAIGRTRRSSIRLRRPALAHGYPADFPHPLLWEFGIHYLDLLRKRHGDGLVVESAELRDIPGGWHADIHLGWSDGAKGRYEQTDGAGAFRMRELILGTRGLVLAGTTRAIVVGRGARWFRWPADNSADHRLLDALIQAIAGAETGIEVADNLETIALIEAVIRSAATRRAVPLAEVLPLDGVRSEDERGV